MQSGRVVVVAGLALVGVARADTAPQEVGSLQQFWTSASLITADDNWAAVPGIVGYRGDGLATAGVDPQSIVADSAVVDVVANQTTPSDGVTEFEIANPTIALRASDTASAPHLVLMVDSSVVPSVRVRYRVRDLDGSATNAVQAVALQYRIGTSGVFTNVPGGFVADATTANSATQTTAVNALLPGDAAQKSVVQIRIITANATGTDEAIGIDDLRVTVSDVPPSGTASVAPVLFHRTQPASFFVTVDPGVGPASTGLGVSCNLSAFLTGVGQTALHDDGLDGDATAGDNVFTKVLTISAAQPFGGASGPCTVSDAEGRSTSVTISGTVSPVCGDGSIDAQELCDDGNAIAGDGCSAVCNPEMGWACSGTPTVCTDVDECADATACVPNSTCTNLPGTYTCACSPGYEGDQTAGCHDVDECIAGDVCDPNATCTNTDGSFTCTPQNGNGNNPRTDDGTGGCTTTSGAGMLLVAFAALLARRRRR